MNFEKVGWHVQIAIKIKKIIFFIFVVGLKLKFIIKKINIGINENEDSRIIFLPVIKTPEIIGCAMINRENTSMNVFVSRLFFVKLMLNFKKNKEKIIKGPKLKRGHIKKINNSCIETFSTKIPKKWAK